MKFFDKGERVRVTNPNGKDWEGVVRGVIGDVTVLVDRPGGLAGVAHVHYDNLTRLERKP